MSILREIQNAIRERELSISLHAQQQTITRRIKIGEIREALLSPSAELIEDYPDDPRGSSCLVYGKAVNRILHVHLSYPPEIVIITAYEPDPTKWETDRKARK